MLFLAGENEQLGKNSRSKLSAVLFLALIYMVKVLLECASDLLVVGKREGSFYPTECALQSAGERVIRKAKICVGVARERKVACSSKNIKHLILF